MTNDMRQTLINADPAVPKFEDEYTPTQKDLRSFGVLAFDKQQKICPVKAVGMMDDVFLYIDGATQFRRVKANEHSINGIRALFVPFDEMLPSLFPRYDKKGNVIGWKADDAAAFLMRACGQKGIFDPAYKERGVGCWRDKKAVSFSIAETASLFVVGTATSIGSNRGKSKVIYIPARRRFRHLRRTERRKKARPNICATC